MNYSRFNALFLSGASSSSLSLVLCFIFLAGVHPPSFAWSLKDAVSNLVGPSIEDVTYSYRLVRKRDEYILGCHNAILLTIQNNSDFYISSARMECDVFDSKKNRLEKSKDVSFNDMFSKGEIAPGNTTTWESPLCEGINVAGFIECELKNLKGKR